MLGMVQLNLVFYLCFEKNKSKTIILQFIFMFQSNALISLQEVISQT